MKTIENTERSLTPAEDSLIVGCIAGSESAAQQVVKLLADSAFWKQEAKRWEELTNAAETQRDAAAELLHEAKLLETAARRFALGSDVSAGYVLSMCARVKQAIAASQGSAQ